MRTTDWFAALGKPVSVNGFSRAWDLLVENGMNPGESELVLLVVAREIEHDEPERAQKYLRSFLPAHGSETLLLRTLATLCTGD